MQLRVYSGEYFQRTRGRYLGFALLLLLLIVLSFWYENQLGGLFLLVLTGGYFYMQTRVSTLAIMELKDTYLQIKSRQIPYVNLMGFVLEVNSQTGRIENLVLLFSSHYEIYTLYDKENIDSFVTKLTEFVPMRDQYQQSFIDKLLRKLKV